MYDFKHNVLSLYIGVSPSEVGSLGGSSYFVKGINYLVLTEQEADEAYRRELSDFIDDFLLSDEEGRELFFSDPSYTDKCDKGLVLAHFDGLEQVINIIGGRLYIYRR